MPRSWTPEQRAEASARAKARHDARKAGAPPVVAPDAPAVLNPIATDVVRSPRPRLRPVAQPHYQESSSPLAVASLISDLSHIPLETISYEECGQLLNALAKASTDVALSRRQRQEQLAAGTHRAACNTCGRPVDISKSGGFQILTERDEHHMPVNRYYCSQNCLLARNMPSHAKQTPRQKQMNQA